MDKWCPDKRQQDNQRIYSTCTKILELILLILSAYVAYNLIAYQSARWTAITAYWTVLAVKNLMGAVSG